MTFTFNMTYTAKTETMMQDEMQQELLNLIGNHIAALPTEAEVDRALKVWKSRFISQTYCGGGSSNHPDIRPAFIEAVKLSFWAAQQDRLSCAPQEAKA
jgi:hypothetical protein